MKIFDIPYEEGWYEINNDYRYLLLRQDIYNWLTENCSGRWDIDQGPSRNYYDCNIIFGNDEDYLLFILVWA